MNFEKNLAHMCICSF